MFTYAQVRRKVSAPTASWAFLLLSAPKTHGNWTDGRIRVVTRRRHRCLLWLTFHLPFFWGLSNFTADDRTPFATLFNRIFFSFAICVASCQLLSFFCYFFSLRFCLIICAEWSEAGSGFISVFFSLSICCLSAVRLFNILYRRQFSMTFLETLGCGRWLN